jgi:hypothetical protein
MACSGCYKQFERSLRVFSAIDKGKVYNIASYIALYTMPIVITVSLPSIRSFHVGSVLINYFCILFGIKDIVKNDGIFQIKSFGVSFIQNFR